MSKKQIGTSPTMTPEEVSVVLRSYGVKTSPYKIREGLKQGAYPFGVYIQMTSPVYEIYTKKFVSWCEENLIERTEKNDICNISECN